jgi:hypothetical protein
LQLVLVCFRLLVPESDWYKVDAIYQFLDIDECLSNPCQPNKCINFDGGFFCGCRSSICYTVFGNINCELRQCKIDGKCLVYGQINPDNQCQVKHHINFLNNFLTLS